MRTFSGARRRRVARAVGVAAAVAGLAVQGGTAAGAASAARRASIPGGGSSLAPAPAGSAAAAALRRAHDLGAPRRYKAVPGYHAGRARRPEAIKPRQLAHPAPAPAWPAAGTATTGIAGGAPDKAPARGTLPAWERAGTLPVWLAATPGRPRRVGASAQAAAGAVTRVRVVVTAHAAAAAAGASGMVFTLARADSGAAPGRFRVRVSYERFASAYGAGFADRLALFALPACALTTPRVRACRAAAPVPAVNDPRAGTLTATVTIPGAGSQIVLAASATTSGGTGDFKGTSLSPSSTWQVGTQSGDFTWYYPMRVPPAVGGAAPSLALSYDSQQTDGETAQDNSQPGQLGEGFSLAGGGYIERRYASCADHLSDSSNNTGQADKTGDLCWDGNNAYLSLGGHSGQIILDSSGGWHLASDDGSIVKEMSGGTTNGAYNNSHWEIITPDGTQYWFGLNQLPGYGSGDQATNSAWTAPVVGLKSGDPCNTSGSYTGSVCPNMAWRWNLDLVVDPNGNATSYYYSPETNYYAFDSYDDSSGNPVAGTPMSYTSAGTLTGIYYGSHVTPSANPGTPPSGNLYGHRPFHVALGYSDRCTSTDQTTCANNENGTDWPDTPWDLHCAQASGCTGSGHQASAFFDTKMLTSVTTSVYEGSSTYQNVDTWTLGYQWLSADVNSDLVLASVTHVGDVGGTTKPLVVTFGYTPMDNRVDYGEKYPSMQRYRLNEVISETGAQTDIIYNSASCSPTEQSDPSSNTWPCFPQEWAAGDFGGNPTVLWFYKYTVSQVIVNDPTGGEPGLVTSYTYCGTFSPQCASDSTGQGAAWHYDTDIDLVPAKDKSYGQWRGYRYVHVVTGEPGDTQSETDYTFIRGMDEDPVKDSSGNWTYPPVTFTPSDLTGTTQSPATITDSSALNGFTAEKITYDGLDTAAEVSDQVSWPWIAPSPTATSATQPWGQPMTAYPTGTAETDTYAPLSGGGVRQTQVVNHFDNSNGLITSTDDYGDLAHPGQAQCTAYSYPSPASTAGLIAYPYEIKTTACGTSGSPEMSDTQHFYDGQALGVAPTDGNITKTQAWSSGDPGVTAHEDVVSRDSYDSYGRLACSESALGADGTCTPGDPYTTSYSYTSTWGTGNPTTQETVNSPLTATTFAATTTNLNPAWGSPTSTTDPNGETTTYCQDPLGRITAAWLPGQSGVSCTSTSGAMYTYAYSVTATAPPYVATTKLVLGSIPVTSYQIYDSLLRPRQTQSPAEGPGGGAEITDTFYDSRGNVVTQNGPYNASTTASGSLWHVTESAVPDQTATSYDGAGRQAESDFDSDGTLQWKTTWSYPGADAVTVVPPAGGTISTTYTDARGRVTEIDQYHSKTSASGAYDATAYGYSYISGGSTKTVTDAGGNTWTWTYDLLGRVVSAANPDTGTTTSTYDDLGQLTSATDAAGKTISWAYDAAGRKTAEYAAAAGSQSGSNELAAWTYDSVKAGQLSSATSYTGGTGGEAYKETINSYDAGYRPTSTTYTIPSDSVTGSLAGSYTLTASYDLDGTPATVGYPAAGPLAAETVNFGYDNKGSPYSEWSSSGADSSDYAEMAVYSPWGAPAEIDLGTSTSAQWSRMLSTYDGASMRLTGTMIQREASSWANDTDTSYAYDHAGNVTSVTDSVTGDNQCFDYDYLARLTAAWSQSSATCPSSPPGASGIGGPAPYQQTIAYDNGGTANGTTNGTTGRITDSTMITGTGSSQVTTDTSYSYPAYGAAQPHAPVSYTTTVSGTSPATTAQTWTPDGQLATAGGTSVSYDWNGTGMAPGQLASATTGSTTSNFRYDASGNLLVRQDGSTSRLYLPGEELSASGSTVSATRYYSLGGQVIAARTSATAVTWLLSNPQGTATVAINPAAATSSQLTWRWYTPFGQFRPPTNGSWPGTRRFVGGTYDSTTGLTNLGAREYNPAAPAFISPDPILNPEDPQDLNPYDYAANNPATEADPTGLRPCYLNSEGQCQSPSPGSGGGGNGGGGNGGGGGGGGNGPGPVQISPHVYVSANDPQLPELRAAWQWEIANYGQARGVDAEFSAWYRACTVSPDASACTGKFKADFSGMTPNYSVETGFQSGVGMLISSAGVAPLIMRNSVVGDALASLARASIDHFASGYQASLTGSGVHGNSLESDAETFLYQLEDSGGNYLKTGITADPAGRYSASYMVDKVMNILTSGSRSNMAALERFIVERDPGPLNFENWAGAFAEDVPPVPAEGGDIVGGDG